MKIIRKKMQYMKILKKNNLFGVFIIDKEEADD